MKPLICPKCQDALAWFNKKGFLVCLTKDCGEYYIANGKIQKRKKRKKPGGKQLRPQDIKDGIGYF